DTSPASQTEPRRRAAAPVRALRQSSAAVFESDSFLSLPRGNYILKLKLMGTSAFTVFPSAVNGANFHFLTASAAGRVNTGLPLTILTFSTAPFSATTASSSTA